MNQAYTSEDGDYLVCWASPFEGTPDSITIEANRVAELERERIIALLETQRDKHWVYNEVGHADAINQALALIKEENK